MKTKKPSVKQQDPLSHYYEYLGARTIEAMKLSSAGKVGYDTYKGAPVETGSAGMEAMQDTALEYDGPDSRDQVTVEQVKSTYERLAKLSAVEYEPVQNSEYRFWWGTPKAPEPEPKPWKPFGEVTETPYKNPKVIETEEYDKLVANQKPEDWDENQALVNLDALTRTLVAREIAFRGLRIEEGSDDYLEIWDNVYDTIFKHKI